MVVGCVELLLLRSIFARAGWPIIFTFWFIYWESTKFELQQEKWHFCWIHLPLRSSSYCLDVVRMRVERLNVSALVQMVDFIVANLAVEVGDRSHSLATAYTRTHSPLRIHRRIRDLNRMRINSPYRRRCCRCARHSATHHQLKSRSFIVCLFFFFWFLSSFLFVVSRQVFWPLAYMLLYCIVMRSSSLCSIIYCADYGYINLKRMYFFL